MKKLYFLAIIALFFSINIGAQDRNAVPHVTDISVESRNNLIRLTWVDSPQARGPVFIFRAARPFIGSIPANIRPVEVRYGQQYYIDDTDDMENVFYFIAASDTNDTARSIYGLIIPHVNSISVNTTHSGEQQVITQPPAVRESIPGISNIWAVQDGERVVITYDSSVPRRSVILYRSMHPVRQPQDLLNAVVVQSGIASPFIDVTVHGITWYYAVIYEDEISSGSMGIRPGVNATVSPVTISSQQTGERSLRPIPLPILTLRSAITEWIPESPEQVPLSIESVNMLRHTQMPQKMPMILKTPRFFSVDLEAPAGGEESALFQIIMEYFVHFDWENAQISLQHYLSLPRSKDVEIRARFYLGQTLYYTEKYREALMEFLTFRTHYPAEANNWIEAVLSAMVY